MYQEINLENLNVIEMKSLCRAFNLPHRLRRAELLHQLHCFLGGANEAPAVNVEVNVADAVEADVDIQLHNNNNNQPKSFLARVFGIGSPMKNGVRKIYYLLPECRVVNRLQQCVSSIAASLGVLGGLYALWGIAMQYSMPTTTIQAEIQIPRFW